MKLKTKLVFVIAASLLLLAGCGGEAEPAMEISGEAIVRETVTEADPEAALEEIYAALPEAEARKFTSYELTENFPDLDPESLISYAGMISSPDGGLSDLIFFEPAEGQRSETRDALQQYQQKRIREFENYDILGAFDIAQNAVVIDQGDYVILLMFQDNEAARVIIDKYIPL